MVAVAFVYFNVILYASFVYLYFFDIGLTSFKPLYWILISLNVGLLLNVFKYGLSWPPLRLKRLIIWAILFLAMSAFSFVAVGDGGASSLQTLIDYAKGGLLLIVFASLLRERELMRHALIALALVAVAAVAINVIDYLQLSPWPLGDVRGRAAGMYVNSNISGKMLVLSMVVSVFCLPKKLRFIYCLLVFAGVLLTFSRSSIMIWFIAVLMLAWQRAFALPRMLSVSIIGGALFLGASLLVSGALVGVLGSAGVELNDNTAARMGSSFFSQRDFSSKGRAYVAKKGINMFLNNPVFGNGIGLGNNPKNQLGAHNSYIQIAAEQGVVGLSMYLILIWLTWRVGTPECRVFAVCFAAFSMFTHNMLDQPTVYLLIAMAVSGITLKSGGKVPRTEPLSVFKS